MTENNTMTNCLLCHEPAVDVIVEDYSFLVQCLDCGVYEILELAAKNIQEHPLDERLRLLERARLISEGQDGPPLIREPFILA